MLSTRITPPSPGPYHATALKAMMPTLQATGLRPLVTVVPDSTGAAVAAKATYEDRVTVPAGSLLWAMSGTSSAAAGFTVQVTDAGTKKPLFSQPPFFSNATGQGSVSVPDCSGALQTLAHPLFVLPRPLVILPPGQVGLQINNLAAAVNILQVCLFFAAPGPSGEMPNEFNAALNLDFQLARLAKRDQGSQSAKLEPVMNHVPFQILGAPGDYVVVAGTPAARITIYELDIWNVALQTITLMDGPDRLRGPLTGFPASSGRGWEDTGKPHFQCSPGRDFIINLSAGTEVSGYVKYKME